MEVPRIGALTETPCTCRPTERVGELRERLVGSAWELCAVVTGGGEGEVVLGSLSPGDLEGDEDRSAEQAMNPAPSTFRPDVPVEEMQRWFAEHEKLHAAPVTTPEGRLLGVITRSRLDAVVPVVSGTG
jgi:CBS domain-containing protein